MALINFTSGRINSTIEVERHVFPDRHDFLWNWRGVNYYLSAQQNIGVIGSRQISQAEFDGEEGADPVFNIFMRHILFQDGEGAFDNDNVAAIIPPGDDPDPIDGDPMLVPANPLPGSGGGGLGDHQQAMETQQLSIFPPAAIFLILSVIKSLGITIFRGVRVPWNSLPQWARTVFVGLGAVEGADFILDVVRSEGADFGIGPVQFPVGGGQSSGDPIGAMVEAMTVSTWNANGVQFHRLSDGRLAVRNKHGVWKIWRPKKPIVIFATGNSNFQDILRADRVLQKEAKKVARMLRSRGFKVSRT